MRKYKEGKEERKKGRRGQEESNKLMQCPPPIGKARHCKGPGD